MCLVLTMPAQIARLHDATTGQVRGRVFDEYRASIPDASITIDPVDPGSPVAPFDTLADARGRFDFIGVPPGAYRLTVSARGYATTVEVHTIAAGVDNEVTVVVRRQTH
jgi:hypothetical protein